MPVRPLHLLQLPDPKRIERTNDIRNQTNAQYSQHGRIVYLHRHIDIRVRGGGSRVAAVQRDHELAAAEVAVRVLVQYVLRDAFEDHNEDGDGGEEKDYGRGEEEDAPAAEVAHGCWALRTARRVYGCELKMCWYARGAAEGEEQVDVIIRVALWIRRGGPERARL